MLAKLRLIPTHASKLGMGVAIGAVVLVGGTTTAGAESGCGATEITFDGVRLLNNGVDHTAGPFEIDLEPGTYDITMRSWDAHDEHHQPEQENEQWYFTLDSGYTSAPAIDVPTEANTATTVLAAQEIGASTSVTVHHLRSGGVNSVEPVCLGFTAPAPVASEEIPDVESETTIADEVPEEADTPTPVAAEVKGVVELPTPASQLVPPASATKEPVSAQAADVVQRPAPQLAITGPSTSGSATLLGVALVALGLVFTHTSSAMRGRRAEVPMNPTQSS